MSVYEDTLGIKASMTTPDWHPEDVKAAIRKTGVTLTQLSIRWGYQPNSARTVLRHPWPAVETLIAQHLHRHPWTIWPSRYDQQNRPLYTRRPSSPRKVLRNRNTEAAA